jgi:hypothetical protein
MGLLRTAVGLVVRSMVLSAQAAGQQRLLRLGGAAMAGEQAESWADPGTRTRGWSLRTGY